jgi:hypothetical protein
MINLSDKASCLTRKRGVDSGMTGQAPGQDWPLAGAGSTGTRLGHRRKEAMTCLATGEAALRYAGWLGSLIPADLQALPATG